MLVFYFYIKEKRNNNKLSKNYKFSANNYSAFFTIQSQGNLFINGLIDLNKFSHYTTNKKNSSNKRNAL